MTPKETYQLIEAFAWRQDRDYRLRILQSWHTAVLSRAKRIPKYQELLPRQPQELTKEEKRRRKAEFEEIVKRMDEKWQNKRR